MGLQNREVAELNREIRWDDKVLQLNTDKLQLGGDARRTSEMQNYDLNLQRDFGRCRFSGDYHGPATGMLWSLKRPRSVNKGPLSREVSERSEAQNRTRIPGAANVFADVVYC